MAAFFCVLSWASDANSALLSALTLPLNATPQCCLNVEDELIERIAERAAELVDRRQEATDDEGWLRGAEKIAAYIDAPRSRV